MAPLRYFPMRSVIRICANTLRPTQTHEGRTNQRALRVAGEVLAVDVVVVDAHVVEHLPHGLAHVRRAGDIIMGPGQAAAGLSHHVWVDALVSPFQPSESFIPVMVRTGRTPSRPCSRSRRS